jgi:hypothetical protein
MAIHLSSLVQKCPCGTATKLPAPSPAPVTLQNLVSEEALQQVSRVAPGWDKHFLMASYKSWVASKGEMPRNADAAFLGWVKKFTKGKRP